jgi:hypothetical protein
MQRLHTKPVRNVRRFHWPLHHSGSITPLPRRRERGRNVLWEPRTDRKMWGQFETHPTISGALRQITVFVLWLLAVLAMILLFAEVAG